MTLRVLPEVTPDHAFSFPLHFRPSVRPSAPLCPSLLPLSLPPSLPVSLSPSLPHCLPPSLAPFLATSSLVPPPILALIELALHPILRACDDSRTLCGQQQHNSFIEYINKVHVLCGHILCVCPVWTYFVRMFCAGIFCVLYVMFGHIVCACPVRAYFVCMSCVDIFSSCVYVLCG
jgi:hypothetical protein